MMRALAIVVLLLLLPAAPCLAWEDAREVVHGSSRVLEKGETLVGIFSPLGYGILERMTIFTHPALLLLLTPAVWTRIAVSTGDSGLAFEVGYEQSWLKTDRDRPGFMQAGVIYSQVFKRNHQITLAAGYLAEFGRKNVANDWLGLYWRVGANFIIKRNNMIIADVRGVALSREGHRIPTASLLYARQFGRMRLGTGASFGEFMVSTNFIESGANDQKVAMYVYPWFDLWWRF